MIFAKIDVVIAAHRRAFAAGPEAMGLWTWGIVHAREQETDGFLPELAVLSAWGGKANRRHADRLVEVGLWETTEGGWRVCRYEAKNETKAEIASRKEKDAQRKRGRRTSTHGSPVSPPNGIQADSDGNPNDVVAGFPGSGSGSGSDSEIPDQNLGNRMPSGAAAELAVMPEAPSEVRPKGLVATPWDLRVRELYVEGIRKGTGAGFVWPDGYGDQGALNRAIREFAKYESGKAIRGSDLAEWIVFAAQEFAEDVVRRGKAEFGFRPKVFAAWLTVDVARRRQASEARACP